VPTLHLTFTMHSHKNLKLSNLTIQSVVDLLNVPFLGKYLQFWGVVVVCLSCVHLCVLACHCLLPEFLLYLKWLKENRSNAFDIEWKTGTFFFPIMSWTTCPAYGIMYQKTGTLKYREIVVECNGDCSWLLTLLLWDLRNLRCLTFVVNYVQQISMLKLYRVIVLLEAPNYCLCIQSNSTGFSFINTGIQVHLKYVRWHFERNLVKDMHHWSVASRNWLKS